MKTILKYSFILLICIWSLALSGCQDQPDITTNLLPKQGSITSNGHRKITVHVSPQNNTRAIVKPIDSKSVKLLWEEGNNDLNIVIRQGKSLIHLEGVSVKNVKGQECSFEVEIPREINAEQAFDLYGIVADHVLVRNGKILVCIGGRMLYALTEGSSNRDGFIPVWFSCEGVSIEAESIEAHFSHLGSLAAITIRNDSNTPFVSAGLAVLPINGGNSFYYKAALPFEGNTALPYIDLLNPTGPHSDILTRVVYPKIELAPGAAETYGFWFCPIEGVATPEVQVVGYEPTSRAEIRSINTRPSRTTGMQIGYAYNIYARWDGRQLILQDDQITTLPKNQSKITLDVDPSVKSDLIISLEVPKKSEQKYVWIDLNNNGKPDEGELATGFTEWNSFKKKYSINSNRVTIYGEVTAIRLNNGDKCPQVTGVEFTECNTNLRDISINGSQIGGTINLSHFSRLEKVSIQNSQLTGIILPPKAPKLRYLSLHNNQLKTVLLPSECTQLKWLYLGSNQLKEINLPIGCTKLRSLWLNYNQLSEVNLPSEYTQLEELMLGGNTLKEISLPSEYTQLKRLDLNSNQLQEIRLPSNLSLIEGVDLQNNQLTHIELSSTPSLRVLYLSRNHLTGLKVTEMSNLVYAEIYDNKLSTSVIQEFLNKLPKTETVSNYYWKPFDVWIGNNTGSEEADTSEAEAKGWKVYK